MTQPGDTVICAVSGGADSVCMLHVLLSLRNTLGITVEAAHFNHQLRGEESDRDEAFVRTLCAELGVVLHVDNGDVRARAAKTHESVEEAARALRYAFFSSLSGRIATAHTQDDNLETVLLNLTRSTGLAGLCGIPPRRERFIRPMLAVSRAEIEAYLAQNGLSHVTDSTNFLPDARRNRLRQSVIPLLKAENPSLCETAFRMCRLLEADEAQLSAQAEAVKQIATYKLSINDYFDLMMIWYRDVLYFKATGDVNGLIFKDEVYDIKRQAEKSSYNGINSILEALRKAQIRLDANVNFDLVIELLLLTIKEN